MWAIKTGGVFRVGTWQDGKGISSVADIIQTDSPQPGDVAAIKEWPEHMALVCSVTEKSIRTIDGNSTNAGVTGPSDPKPKSNFTASFFAAFRSPVGKWNVQIGVWTWIYTFDKDGTAKWTDIRTPPTQAGGGKWDKTGEFLEISWDTGSREQWDLPLKFSGQQGTLIGQGPIINANKLR